MIRHGLGFEREERRIVFYTDTATMATMAGNKTKTLPVIARGEIEAMIADGRKVIIFDQHVLKVDPWLQYHPGGDKAILHMVGRDATDEATV